MSRRSSLKIIVTFVFRSKISSKFQYPASSVPTNPLLKRLKRDSVQHFNKKSNEEQYNANKAIKDAVEDAQIALENKDLQKTKEALEKGIEFLQERQKLIL